jgi:4-hydroxy-3-methylbut-2-enyl diphosphate reductase
VAPEQALVVAAPLGVEAHALRRGLPGGMVVRAGLRARYRHRVATALCERDPAVLAVAGVAGALVPGLRPGDVVVASEVRSARGVLDCPSAPMVAAALRRAGLTPHIGPIVESDKVVDGAGRDPLAATGAIAVDMESARLLEVAGQRPSTVVRVVVDTPRQPLLHPASLPGGVVALARLSRIGPVLRQWASTVQSCSPQSAAETVTFALPKEVRDR